MKKINLHKILRDLGDNIDSIPMVLVESFFDLLAMEKDMDVTKTLLKDLVISYAGSEKKLREALQERDRLLGILKRDLAEASEYVSTSLPRPLNDGIIRTKWSFIPATTVGGDSFGYHYLDDDHFAMYLLDVSGHGVGSALLSVSVANTLRSQSLPGVDFKEPDLVLDELNKAFPAGKHYDMFFTIWYGVYSPSTRLLKYSSGGHPPAVLLAEKSDRTMEMIKLTTTDIFIGNDFDFDYHQNHITIPPNSSLYIFSDGVFEIRKPDQTFWSYQSLLEFLHQNVTGFDSILPVLVDHAKELNGHDIFEDDFSVMEIFFNPS